MELEVTPDQSQGPRGNVTLYKVAERFTPDLGGRSYEDGEFSGQEFRDKALGDLVAAALASQEVLVVDFDGVSGMPTSFLEEAFGGLVREHPDWKIEDVERILKIEAPSTPKLWPYVRFAQEALRKGRARN